MPLGFAKSILSKGAAPSVGGTVYDGYWHPNGSISGDTLAIVQWGDSTGTTAPFSSVSDVTLSVWWRGFNYANNEVANSQNDTPYMRYGWNPTDDGFQWQWPNSQQAGRLQLLFKNGGYIYTDVSGGDFGALDDGNWHHIYFVYDADNSGNSKIYVDGVSQSIVHGANGVANTSTVEIVSFQDITRNTTSVETINQNYWDMAQFVMYDSVVDDVSKFYNSGFVNLGSDGTASGLSQPPIYIYVDEAGALQQGGSNSASVFTSALGAVSVTTVASTGSTDLSTNTSRSARDNS